MNQPYLWTPEGPRPLDDLLAALEPRRAAGERVVSTNGCFDVLHAGHVALLSAARAEGGLLVVGLNSDASVRRLKGAGRPLVPEDARAALLAALGAVDYVVVFDAPTPNELLAALRPDVHCKAGDYTVESLPETPIVQAGGGEVRILPLIEGYSTSRLIATMLARSQDDAPATAGRDASELLLDDANLIRQTGYALRQLLPQAAALVAQALARGNDVSVCGNRGSGALVGAAGLPYDVFLPPGRGGDVLLVVMPDDPPEELAGVIAAARARGITAIALLADVPSPLVDVSDLCLRVPTADVGGARLAMVAALRAIGTLVAEYSR